MSASHDTAVVAHGIHCAILTVGVVGLVALLAPRFIAGPLTNPRTEPMAGIADPRRPLLQWSKRMGPHSTPGKD
jgi:hypothetical protein